MKYPAYPDYKDSPIPWLPKVPAKWDVHRLKWAVTSCDNGVWGEEPDGGPDDVACIRVADFDRLRFSISTDNLTMRSIDARQRASRQVRKGDLLIEKSGGGEKQLVGCVVQFGHDFPAVCSNFVARMGVAEGQNSRYWTYAHAALYAGRLNDPAIKQTTGIQNLDAGEYLNNLFAYAPAEEQKKIADFLDWRTAQIDALIAKKQSLLERLTEKRVNVIASSVTNGLVRQVEVRPSGAAWFAEVPKHWQVKRIKFIGTVGNGSTPARDDSGYWNEGSFPWLNSSVANQEAVTEAEQFVTPLALKECHLPIIEPPAVLVGITGQGKTRGMATTLMIRATINQHLAYIKPVETECEVRFLRRVFDAAYAYLRNESDGGGSTKGAITCEQIAELPIPLPPLKEQQAIADHIDKVLGRINRIAENATNAIERLTEYRSALITAAVTGQIDVRNVQIKGRS